MRQTFPRALLLGGLLAVLSAPAAAAPRQRTELHPAVPPPVLEPAAAAPAAMSAPILSGLDYTAIAPPGTRLRVIEDEPYTYVLGGHSPRLAPAEGVTRLRLTSGLAENGDQPAGYYEVELSLRGAFTREECLRLLDSFDAAADSAYRHALLTEERRGALGYELAEVRSPLGLGLAHDPYGRSREYLSYSAEALNPLSGLVAGCATPYQYVTGELRCVRTARSGLYLLALSFEAGSYPHALTLTENIARCVLNRLDPLAKPQERLGYLAYHPEYETAVPEPGESVDPRAADLAEQPGEGCGTGVQPIQGDRCPVCQGTGPFWPARPYAVPAYGRLLGERLARAACSHCLLAPADARRQPLKRKAVQANPASACPRCAGT